MKTIAILLLIAATASADEWTNLRVTFMTSSDDPLRENSLFETPSTLSNVSDSWQEVEGINNLGLTTYCYVNDGQFCVLFDSYGHLSGFQVAYLVSDGVTASSVYNPADRDVVQIKTIFGNKYYTITVYTVSPDTLASGGRADTNDVIGEEGIWIEKSDGTYMEVPRNVADFDSIWKQEACVSEMGTHYYYDMTTTKNCSTLLPLFILANNGEISGVGMQSFGSITKVDRQWGEVILTSDIKPGIPTSPQCLTDWADDYDYMSIHIFFTEKPWNISC